MGKVIIKGELVYSDAGDGDWRLRRSQKLDVTESRPDDGIPYGSMSEIHGNITEIEVKGNFDGFIRSDGRLVIECATLRSKSSRTRQRTGLKGPHVEHTRIITRNIALALRLATIAILLTCARAEAQEKTQMPLGAFLCKSIDPVIEHAKMVRAPTSAGLRELVEAKVASGDCRVIKSEVTVTVVDVDQRSFALIEEPGQSGKWWTDAENVWGYFDTPAKVKAWKKP